MRLEEVFLNDLAQSNLVDVDRPPMRIDITGVGQPTLPEDFGQLPPASSTDLTDVATQMAGGSEPEGATPMTLRQFATTAADVPAGLLKGGVQGSIGLPGDIISLARGLYDLGASGGNLDAFLAGLEKPTGLPTTEDVKTFFDKTLGIPLVPEGASDRRMEAVKTAEFVGELGGAGKTAIAGTRAAVRGARDIVQEMATTPPRGSVQIRPTPVQTPTPVQAPRSGLGFYSAVEETVANLPQAKGSGQQFLAQIQKTSGVKPDEIKWTGLDEFLKGKKSVTKAEIQDYLNANRVEVREIRLGEEPQTFNSQQEALNYLAEKMNLNVDGVIDSYLYNDPNDYIILANRLAGSNTPQPRFEEYTLPGGENYRELLLTLPVKERVVETQVPAGKRPKVFEDTATSRFELLDSFGETRAVFNTRAEAEKAADEIAAPFVKSETVRDPEFYSTHFDQPNVLAHMRVNDRVVDGKKTLFIEEIQSDWHQAGRKKGYAQQLKPEQLKASEVLPKQPGPRTWTVTYPNGNTATFAGNSADDAISAAVARESKIGVPDAPFKTSWHELTLKRAIQEASEKGYDQIAFTTGKTQVERYPEALRQVADDISWSNIDESGRKYVDIKKDGNIVLQVSVDQSGEIYQSSIQDAYGKTLDEFVGKPMAQRVTSESQGTIKGQDFTVGGKGMEGFYDNILPKSLEKLGKKFDAKVGKTQMDGVEVWQMDITPEMRGSVTTKGQPLFAVPAAAAAGAATMRQPEERM